MWITPKTNWQSTDYFNIEDYERIVGNHAFLHEKACALRPSFTIAQMVATKAYTDMFYASEMNTIEDNLEAINEGTYDFEFGEKPVYVQNGATPTYEEFNRIESAQLKLYKTLLGEESTLPTLEFTLGLEDF